MGCDVYSSLVLFFVKGLFLSKEHTILIINIKAYKAVNQIQGHESRLGYYSI